MANTILKKCDAKNYMKRIDSKEERITITPTVSRGPVLIFIFIMVVILIMAIGSIYWWEELLIETAQTALIFSLLVTILVNGVLNWFLPRVSATHEIISTDSSFNQAEHFRNCFSDILKTSDHKKITIIVDNLDRVEPADALEMIRMLKAFIINDILNKKKVVFIIPCDIDELANHVKKVIEVEDSHEFLRKIFNITISVPKLVHENIYQFTGKHFEEIEVAISPPFTPKEKDNIIFIIASASRRNPRQVKTLLNDFSAFWRAASLIGTTGVNNGISPQGAAYFIVLKYYLAGKELPIRIQEITKDKLKKEDSKMADYQLFYEITEPIRTRIDQKEWMYLQRLILSDDEKGIPELWEIEDAILSYATEEVESLIPKELEKRELLESLDRKMAPGGRFSQIALGRYLLCLLENEKIVHSGIPFGILESIELAIIDEWDSWEVLVRGGLASVSIETGYSPAWLQALLKKIGGATPNSQEPLAQDAINVRQFISTVIKITKKSYWEKNQPLVDHMDKAIRVWGKEDSELAAAAVNHIYLISNPDTGTNLADTLANNFVPEFLTENQIRVLFDGIDNETHNGAIAFASKWVYHTPQKHNANNSKLRSSLTLESVIFLYSVPNDILKTALLNEGLMTNSISRLESFSVSSSKGNLINQGLIAAISLSILASLLDNMARGNNSTQARNAAMNHVWPNLTSNIDSFGDEDTKILTNYLLKHPYIVASIQDTQVSALLQIYKLPLLSIIANGETYERKLPAVLNSLLNRPYWGDAIRAWVNTATKNRVGQDAVGAIYSTLKRRQPVASKYEETVGALKSVKKRQYTKQMTRDHANWLIGQPNWGAQDIFSRLEGLIPKLMNLEKLAKFGEEFIGDFRKKLEQTKGSFSSDYENRIGGLTEEYKNWLVDRLAKNNS